MSKQLSVLNVQTIAKVPNQKIANFVPLKTNWSKSECVIFHNSILSSPNKEKIDQLHIEKTVMLRRRRLRNFRWAANLWFNHFDFDNRLLNIVTNSSHRNYCRRISIKAIVDTRALFDLPPPKNGRRQKFNAIDIKRWYVIRISSEHDLNYNENFVFFSVKICFRSRKSPKIVCSDSEFSDRSRCLE